MANDNYRLKKGNEVHGAKHGEDKTLCGESIAKGENRGVLYFFTQLTCSACRRVFGTDRPHIEGDGWSE